MKFRTEITPHPLRESIAYSSRIFAMGSCFAENISERLQRAKFRVVSNPTGIMFNPASIAASLERFAKGRPYAAEEFTHADGRWFSFDAHTSLSGKTAEEALAKMNCAVQAGHEALERADWVILTFGTSWIYELNATGRVVANCHKRPQSHFTRRRLSADEIVGMYDRLMTGLLREKNVIFTVSPVRHVGDGLEGNSVSKAVLRVAVDEIVGRHDNAFYFPSYEIVNDDLRDYRFYDRDLVHPNSKGAPSPCGANRRGSSPPPVQSRFGGVHRLLQEDVGSNRSDEGDRFFGGAQLFRTLLQINYVNLRAL